MTTLPSPSDSSESHFTLKTFKAMCLMSDFLKSLKTAHARMFLQKLIEAKVVEKLPAFCVNRRFVTALKKAGQVRGPVKHFIIRCGEEILAHSSSWRTTPYRLSSTNF
jgi:hypothetical protein